MAPQHRKIVKSLNSIEFEECCLLWQGLGFNRILTVPNRCPTVARSTSAACCYSQSASQPNRCPIQVSRMMSLRGRLSQTIARSMSAAGLPGAVSISVSRFWAITALLGCISQLLRQAPLLRGVDECRQAYYWILEETRPTESNGSSGHLHM